MKIIIFLIFALHSYVSACTLCATEIPQVGVDVKITYDKKETFFDIKWKFHKTFVSSLTQYDVNKNKIFDPEEQALIKQSLVEYIEQLHYLTDVEYKNINKLTKPEFIKEIKLSLSELLFREETMVYNYKFSLPFVLENRYSLYVGFSDFGDNFAFSITNLTLHNYPHSYIMKKGLISTTIELDDPSVRKTSINEITSQETNNSIIENTPITTTVETIEDSFLELLSEELTKLKDTLKLTLKDIKDNNSISSFLWLLLFSFLYGVLHAIGPGHGKSLVSSYFINQDKSYFKAFTISCTIGIVHTFSAFVLTLVVYFSVGFIFNSTLINVEQVTTKVSAFIIILIAVYLIIKKIKRSIKKNTFIQTTKPTESFSFQANTKPTNILSPKIVHTNTLDCGCHSCKTTSTDLGVILAAGIIPCPGTVTIFLFTMGLGIYFVGFISALFMSMGMSFIIFITAILSVKVRKSSSQNTTLIRILEYVSLFFILFLGFFLLLVS